MRVVEAAGYVEPRDALAQDWAKYMEKSLKGIPWIALPNLGAPDIVEYCNIWGVNRLILTGGNDIGQAPNRDKTEFALLDWAASEKVPTLGICRGMQVMAVWAGAKLKSVEGHVAQRHYLQGEFTHEVCCYHNQSLASCPDGFAVTARSSDDEIEAIRSLSLPWEGWMWHPEREQIPAKQDMDGFRRILK